MVAVALVQACSAFHNYDPYGVEDALAYSDASVEEVCDDGDDLVVGYKRDIYIQDKDHIQFAYKYCHLQ
jgi:hypothetical protein